MIKSIDEYMLESQSKSYGCILFPLNMVGWDFNEILLSNLDLSGDGFEKEPHVSLLYGIHTDEVSVQDIQNWLNTVEPFSVKFGAVSAFKNDNFEVLKFEIISEELHRLREESIKLFPNTQTFPNYKPHCTIAYLKRGAADKYINSDFVKHSVNVNVGVYSVSGSGKDFFNLKKK